MTASDQWIPVSEPSFAGREKEYVVDALDSTWISSSGKYLDRFEEQFANYCGTRHGVAVCNGTVAIHLALAALGVGPGDEVIVPTLTFVATANAVTYCGARPVLADCEEGTWNIDPDHVERLCTPRTKAVLPVHLLGLPCDMERLRLICEPRGIVIVEDAAEAHGASLSGRKAGSMGVAGTFSFYGNKIITTGEGGMVVCDDPELAARLRLLRGQGMDPKKRYWFPEIGFNYRMTNLAAAIGAAQLEDIDWHLEQRARIAGQYRNRLDDPALFGLQADLPESNHAHWSVGVVLPVDEAGRDQVMANLKEDRIDSRPMFYPMHLMPPYEDLDACPVATNISSRGILLPSFSDLGNEQIARICGSLKAALDKVV